MSEERRIIWSQRTLNVGYIAGIDILGVAGIQKLQQLRGKALAIDAILPILVDPCDEEAVLKA
jgi:hypothetical protein